MKSSRPTGISRGSPLRQAIVDRRAALGIVRRGQRRWRLVEAVTGASPSPAAPACRRLSRPVTSVEQGRRRGELFAIECDASFGDHPLDFAARGDSGTREQLGNALRPAFARLWRLRDAHVAPALRRCGTGSLASFVAGAKSLVGVKMLFGKRKQVVKRILIVEDEPLTAFDNENMLGDAGYEVVATVDDLDEALEVLEREEVASDPQRRPPARASGPASSLPRAAKERGVPTLFATGHPYPGAPEIAVGCLLKPYTRAPAVQGDRMRRPPSAGREGQSRPRASSCSSSATRRD